MIMSIIKFILLAIRPASKLGGRIGWWDGINSLVWFAYAIIPSVPGIDLSEGRKLAWFIGIPTVLFLIAGSKLQSKVDKDEGRLPKLTYRLLSFPRYGGRIVEEGEDELQEGYAKIGIRNHGGKVEDCYGSVCSLTFLNVTRREMQIKRLVFTSEDLCWDGNGQYMTIVNDGVERYLNIAYIDQHKYGSWRLAIGGNQKKDFSSGWLGVDIIISSKSTEMEAIKIKAVLGLGEIELVGPGIELWDWEKWLESKLKELEPKVAKQGSEI